MKYVVRFVVEEIVSALKKAGIAKGKENVISVGVYGKKKKEFEYEGVQVLKYWTSVICVGPTMQASAGVYAEVRYIDDDGAAKREIPEKTVLFHVPGSFRDAIEAMSLENEAVLVAFDDKEVCISGANGNNQVKFQFAAKPVFFNKLEGDKVTISVSAADFVSGVRTCAGALMNTSKGGFGNSIGVMPCLEGQGSTAAVSLLATDMTNIAGMDFKALGVIGEEPDAYKEKVKQMPYFMLDAPKLQAVCAGGNAKKMTLTFQFGETDDVKVPQRLDIRYGECVFQMVTGAKCYTLSMKEILGQTEQPACEFTCQTKTLVTACNLEAVGKAMNTNPPILLTVSGNEVGVSGEQSRSRIAGAEVSKAPEGVTEIYVGIPVLLTALKCAGEKVTVSLTEKGLIAVQPADVRARFCTTQKVRQAEQEKEVEEEEE